MTGTNYLEGYVYHMVHYDNVESIFQRRALLSKERVLEEGINSLSIATETVQSLRDRVYIWDFSIKRPRSLHSFVPFYFATLTPMLYVQFKKGIQERVVFFAVSRSIVKEPGVIFTDGNTSNQQLSKYGREKVLVIPANLSNGACSRRYSSGGPRGTNQKCSNYYSGEIFLERLNWDVINDRWFDEEEKRRIKHAEVLVPDLLPLSKVQGIFVKASRTALEVNNLIEGTGLAGRIPGAVSKPELYF